MKLSNFVPLLVVLALSGCENSVEENVGALPNNNYSGVVASGNVRNVTVQAIGIDSNGQPQRNSAGEFFADKFVVDELGRFKGAIQGAYSGSLLLVASFNTQAIEVTCGVSSTEGGCLDADNMAVEFSQSYSLAPSQVRCAVALCKDALGQNVALGQWYAVADDFQMWAVVNQIQDGDTLAITPVTHLAAKLAFTEFVSDGVNCTDGEAGVCETSASINGMFSPQSIQEANDRVRQLFLMNKSFHVQTLPWSPYLDNAASDSILQVEQAKHGLLAATWQQFSFDRNENLKTTLDWWLASFINNEGQLLGDDAKVSLAKELDIKVLYENAQAIASENTADDGVSLAAQVLASVLAGGLTNNASAFKGVVYPNADEQVLFEEKIAAARALVEKVQTWISDLENKQYSSFFDEKDSTVMADDFELISQKWSAFQMQLAPTVQGLFRPMSEFVNYSLSCLPSAGNCATDYAFADQVTIDTEENSFVLSVNQDSDQFPKLSMQGVFEDTSVDGVIRKTFTFSKTLIVETQTGRAQLVVDADNIPSIAFSLVSDLAVGVQPDISAMTLAIPSLKVDAKDPVLGGYQDLSLVGENVAMTMVAVSDALFPEKPKHFNILTMEVPGKIQYGSGEALESMDFAVTLTSKNAFTFYTGADEDIFPDLDFTLDLAAFKQYSQFGEVDFSTSQLSGWLQPPSDIEVKKITDQTVLYVQESTYENLENGLKNILQLNQTQFSSGGYGALEYPGGISAWVIYKNSIDDTSQLARQCLKASGKWGCFDAQAVSSLGCGENYGEATSTVLNVFKYFQNKGCIDNVKIDGAGTYKIEYGAVDIVSNTAYPITFLKPVMLGLDSFNARIFTRFKDASNKKRPVAFLNILAQVLDEKNTSVGVSLTHDYIGFGGLDGLDLSGVVPYGAHTLWFAMGQQGDVLESDGTQSDALVYYIQDGSVTLSMKAFDRSAEHDEPLGYIRYSGSLVATIGKEGNLYVVRYVDDTWQLL